jgi:acyl-CoA synthetase (AMP-forming)/AMP-acid ligase II
VVDSVDQGSRKRPRDRAGSGQEIAYLQYTSGSTREPAGVVVTNRNLSANFEQMYADYFRYNVKVAEEPQQRTAGDGETNIDTVLPSLVFGAGETINGSITLTPQTDM